ncbi:MAG: hypothetical protein ABIH92_01000 [Nanoarchaeota archaeon]
MQRILLAEGLVRLENAGNLQMARGFTPARVKLTKIVMRRIFYQGRNLTASVCVEIMMKT